MSDNVARRSRDNFLTFGAPLIGESEIEEIIGMCTRVVVMREGRITGILTGDQIQEEEIMYHATGLRTTGLNHAEA